MEEFHKHPDNSSEPAVLSKNLEEDNRVSTSTQEPDMGPSVELHEEASEVQPQEKQVLEKEKNSPQSLTSLQRHLTTLVTDIQTAADARESLRRKQLEEARQFRLELLENDMKSSQERFAEITQGWSLAQEKPTAEELQEALNSQQQLLTSLLQDKKKVISDLQHELKVGDDRFIKDLRKQAEERDLMMERMEDQIKTLTKAYREELARIQTVNQQKSDDLLTRDMTEWERRLKELWDTELERLTERRKTVADFEGKIHSLIYETMDKQTAAKIEQNAKLQALEREHQQILGSNIVIRLKQIKGRHELDVLVNSRMDTSQTEKKNSVAKLSGQGSKTSQRLTKEYKQSVLQYERLQKKIKQITLADDRTFEDMWVTIDAEVKQLVERASEIDSLICKQHYGKGWEQPSTAFRDFSGSVRSQKPGHSLSRADQRPRAETDSESTDVDECEEGAAVQSDAREAELEEETLSMETLTKVMEPLWEELGFLMEDDLKLLDSLEEEEQTAMKLGTQLFSFGIDEEDLPKLVRFFLKYRELQRDGTRDFCGEPSESAASLQTNSPSNLTSDLIHPNDVLPALKSFLKQYRKSSHQQSSALQTAARDSSEGKAYWESLGGVISEDRVKLWEETEKTLTQYNAILSEISEHVTETDSLKQQNAELRMLLQHSLNPTSLKILRLTCESRDKTSRAGKMQQHRSGQEQRTL